MPVTIARNTNWRKFRTARFIQKSRIRWSTRSLQSGFIEKITRGREYHKTDLGDTILLEATQQVSTLESQQADSNVLSSWYRSTHDKAISQTPCKAETKTINKSAIKRIKKWAYKESIRVSSVLNRVKSRQVAGDLFLRRRERQKTYICSLTLRIK